MSDELEMENSQNPEGEASDEQTPNAEKETPNEKTNSPEQYTEREKRYYARMKQAENIAKQAREELVKARKPVSEVDVILEVQEATQGLTAPEIAELKWRADAKKLSLTEARKDENFVLWQKAWKEKVEKENPPLPSTTQGNVKEEKSLKDMTLEERTKIFEDAGLITKQIKPRPPRE